jgi:hypothetical protein
VDTVEADAGERLVQPLGGTFGLVDGLALDAAAWVTGSVERVDGPVGAERGGVRVPHGRATARAVHQDDRGAGFGGGVRGSVPVDVRRPEVGLHVEFCLDGSAHRVNRVAGREVPVAQGVVHIAADIGAGAGRGL